MCYGWYTIVVIIRTRWEGFQRDALVAFAVIGNDFQMIVIDIDSIDKGFDNMPAEGRIRSVAFCELMKEKYHTVFIKQLGLGILQRFDGNAEVFGIILQVLQHGGG